MTYTKHILISISFVLLSSCVSLTRYQEIEESNQLVEAKNSELTEENRKLKASVNESDSKIQKLEKEKTELESDKNQNFEEYTAAKQEAKKYEDLYNELLTNRFSSGISSGETKKLLSKLQAYQDDIQKREDKLSKAREALRNKERNLNKLKSDIDKKNRRLNQLEAELRKKDALNNKIKKAIADALLNFKDKGFGVKIRDGKVYVSLDNKLLFKSGKYNVKAEGVKAISQLASAIAKNKDINIVVEGHTDDVPFNGKGAITDNWDLSVRRATSVVRILSQNKGISGKQITAAGRSKYIPKAKGKTASARAQNRRIEIIISPNLGEIYKLVN